jgi:hypothetical protein
MLVVELSNGKKFVVQKSGRGVEVNGNFFAGFNSPNAFVEWWRTILAPGITLSVVG